MRARNIKPGFFENADLAEYGPFVQLLFAGLWLLGDRKGRLKDDPRWIKAKIFPYYDPPVSVDAMLEMLNGSFITRYEVNGCRIIQISNFLKHQTPHVRESESAFPGPEDATAMDKQSTSQGTAKVGASTSLGADEPSPRSPDSLIPDSLIPGKKEISRFSTAKTATPPEPSIPAATAADLDLPETSPEKTKKPAGNGKAKQCFERQRKCKVLKGTGTEPQSTGKVQQDIAWHGNGPATLGHGSVALSSGLDQHGISEHSPGVAQHCNALNGAEGDGDERSPPGVSFITRSKKKLNGWKAEAFGRFWDTFNLKHGRAEAADAWLNIAGLDAETAEAIIRAAGREAKDRPGLLADGGKPKWAQGWLTGRRWEDEALTVEGAAEQRPESWAERKAREMAEKGML